MVQRQSEGINLTPQDTTQYAQANGQYRAPQFSQTTNVSTHVGTNSNSNAHSDRVLQTILGDAGNIMQVGLKTSQEEAYLQGASKVGQIKSEAELEGNPITRDWAVAGYRDTSGRMALAAQEASLPKDMLTLREQSPEKMQEYLAKRRAELVPTLEGMSRTQRAAQFGQLLLNDTAAISTHTAEHTKFIIETEQKSFQGVYATSLAALTRATASGSPESQADTLKVAAGTLYSMVLANDKLPGAIKQKMLSEATQHALAENQVALYDVIRNQEVPDPTTGKPATMFSMLPESEQIKLSNQHREAMGRTEAMRGAQYGDELGKYKAVLSDPTADAPNKDELDRFMDYGTRQGHLGKGERVSLNDAYWTKVGKQGNEAALATALVNGDRESIFKQGKTEKDALTAWTKSAAKSGMSRDQVIQGLATHGSNGFLDAFTQMGDMTKGDVASMLNTDGKVNAQSATVVHNILTKLSKLEADGKDGSFTSYLKAFDPSAQSTLTYMREGQRQGMGAEAAAQFASQRVTEDKKYTPEQRTAISEASGKDDTAYAYSLGEKQFFGNLYNKAKGIVGLGDGSNKLNTYRAWFENPDRVAESVEQTRIAVLEEMGYVSKISPMKNVGDRASIAIAEVQKRTISTEGGNLILPRGANIQQYFGVPASAGNEDIGKALNSMVKPMSEDGRIQFSAHEGRVKYTEYGKDGLRVQDAVISPKDVAKQLQDMWAGAGVTADQVSGSGVTRKVGGLDIQFNGRNTAAVPDDLVFKFRDNLIKHEGVRDTPYKDLSGKIVDGAPVMTVGVGVSSHNPHYPAIGLDGRVGSREATESFRKASNDAAVAGANVQRSVGIKGNDAFLLYSELAYQSGTAFYTKPAYKEMLGAMRSGDADKAVEALRKTPAWTMSGKGSDRQVSYEALLRKSMKG